MHSSITERKRIDQFGGARISVEFDRLVGILFICLILISIIELETNYCFVLS